MKASQKGSEQVRRQRSPKSAAASKEPGAPTPRSRSDDDTSSRLGERIKRLRIGSGITLDELARRSNVSRAMLSKMERGEKSPTLSIISRTAIGLQVSLSTLLGAEPDSAEIAVIRKNQGLRYSDPATGITRQLLSPNHINNGVEVLLHVLPPGKSSGDLPVYSTPTEKYLVVMEGRLTFITGELEESLDAGDSCYFEVKRPYRFDNKTSSQVSYLLIVVRGR